MKLTHQSYQLVWIGHPSLVGAALARQGKQPLDELLPAQRRAHLDTNMHGGFASVPAKVRKAGRSDHDLSGPGPVFDAVDPKARRPSEDFPALLDLGVDMLRRAVPRPSPEVVELEQPSASVGRRLAKDDALAGDRVLDLIACSNCHGSSLH
jgi:hypothetical protein